MSQGVAIATALNESPSEKEGKFDGGADALVDVGPSMKVPPKRKGNVRGLLSRLSLHFPQ